MNLFLLNYSDRPWDDVWLVGFGNSSLRDSHWTERSLNKTKNRRRRTSFSTPLLRLLKFQRDHGYRVEQKSDISYLPTSPSITSNNLNKSSHFPSRVSRFVRPSGSTNTRHGISGSSRSKVEEDHSLRVEDLEEIHHYDPSTMFTYILIHNERSCH